VYNNPHPQPINEAQGIIDQLFGDDKLNDSDNELFPDVTNNNGGSCADEAGRRDVTATNHKETQQEKIAKLIASNKKKKRKIKGLKAKNKQLKRKV
jgi:hypothetical protein